MKIWTIFLHPNYGIYPLPSRLNVQYSPVSRKHDRLRILTNSRVISFFHKYKNTFKSTQENFTLHPLPNKKVGCWRRQTGKRSKSFILDLTWDRSLRLGFNDQPHFHETCMKQDVAFPETAKAAKTIGKLYVVITWHNMTNI